MILEEVKPAMILWRKIIVAYAWNNVTASITNFAPGDLELTHQTESELFLGRLSATRTWASETT